MIARLVERKSIDGGILFGILSHRLRGRLERSIHADKRRVTHAGSERRRREQPRYKLF